MSIESVHIGNLISEVQHDALTAEQSFRAKNVYDRIGRFIGDPFEKFEASFLCDHSPDRELRVWDTMARAFELSKPKDEERVAIAQLVLLLSMNDTLTQAKWKLSRRVVDRVYASWQQAKQEAGLGDTVVTVQLIPRS